MSTLIATGTDTAWARVLPAECAGGGLGDPGGPTWSADGRVAVLVAAVEGADHRWVRQVWRIDCAAGDLTPVCRAEPIRTVAGRWVGDIAPDGSHVAYVAEDQDQPRLVLAACADRTLTKIHNERAIDALRFSPDGKRLAYVSTATREVVVLDLAQSTGVRLGRPDLLGSRPPILLRWTDDGRSLMLLTADGTLCTVTPDTLAACRIWPDTWEGVAEPTEFSMTRVPLEDERLLPATDAFETVPPAAADLEPSLKELPVQVVVEQ